MNETERTMGDMVRDKLHELIHYTWKKNVKGIRLLGWHFYMSRRPMRLKTTRAYDSTLRSEDRRAMFEALWERSGGRCELCGKQMDRETRKTRKVTPDTAQCHHVIPLSMHVPGTEKDINNIQLLCMECHRDLHANPVLYSAYITEALRARGLNPLDYFGDKQQLNKII